MTGIRHAWMRLGIVATLILVPAAALAQTFTLSRASINFGLQTLGTPSAPVVVNLRNGSNTPLTFTTSAGADFQVTNACGGTVSPRTTCAIQVTFTPVALGERTGTLTVTDTTQPANTQLVSLRGTGVSGTIQVAPTAVTFPATLQGATATAITVRLTNDRATPLNQISLVTSGPFSATGCATSVGAGGGCNIQVRFAPQAAHVGVVTGTLSVSAPAAPNTLTVSLSGTGVPRVLLSSASLDFGNAAVGSTSAPLVLTVRNNQTGQFAFASTPVSFTGPGAADFLRTATTCGTRLAAGATCMMSVAFRPGIGGVRSATLAINTNVFGSPHTIPVTGRGTAPLTVTPASIDFGNGNVGLASPVRLVTIRNNQVAAAPIVSIVANGDFARQAAGTTCGATLAAGATCAVAVTMTPTAGSPRTGSLIITSQTSESPNVVLLSGYGTNAVTASVGSLTFPTQAVNTTSPPQQVVLTNHQSVPASPNTQIAGDFAAVNACGASIPPQSTCAVSVTFTPLAAGSRSGTVTFASPGGPNLLVSLSGVGAQSEPPASVATVTPGAGTIGTAVLGVVITGNGFTHFSSSSTVDFGAGITASNLRNVSAGSLTVNLAIAAGAVPGARTVTVSTPYQGGTETASRAVGFVVSASDERSISSVVPDTGAQGQTLTVQIVGSGTHFEQGVTIATFGDGVVVNSLTVVDQTHASANVTVSPTAVPGWRAVRLVTGGEFATLTPAGSEGPGFNVVAGPAALASVSPATGAQGGAPFTVTVTGSATHFLQGTTQVSFGSGINVGAVQVVSPTELSLSIAVTGVAVEGLRDVTATTGGEVARLTGGFTVTPAAPPSIASVTPSAAAQGAAVSITIVGVNTHFTTDVPAPALTIGGNIDVTALQVVDDTTVAASIAISALAATGARQGHLTTGAATLTFDFAIQPSLASLVGLVPPSGGQGRTIAVAMSGFDTHWQQGATTAIFDDHPNCIEPLVTRITVGSTTSAVLDIQIPANACVGPALLRVQTGGEVVTRAFGVYAQTASLTLSPSAAMVGRTVTVNFLGEFSHLGGQTTAVIDGTGVAVQNFTVTSAASASATFAVAADALPGLRSVTLTSPLSGGAFEVLTAAFAVTTTPAILTAIEPFHALAGAVATGLRILGRFTHFNEQTTVSFGPNVQVSNLAVASETELSFDLEIDAEAAIGWRSAFVNTGSEQLTVGFRLDGPAAPALIGVSPSSGAQGESLTVTITGANTNFNQASQLILGAGVTVADFTVTSPTTATAAVAVSATAPAGPNTVIVLTDTDAGQEIATGAGFSVVAGIGQIVSVTPNAAAQGQVLGVSLVGQATHWLQGGSTADFGPGIVVNQFNVLDATHATAQVAVLSGAPLGFRTVTVTTDGEYSSLVQAFSVQQGTATLLSSAPNSGAQGATFDVQVLGQFTHWEQGSTTASYGVGVTVNSVTVVDSVSAVLNVTIQPTAAVSGHPNCRALTITTGTEQVSLPDQLCVSPGPAAIATVSPNAAPQGSTLTVQVTGSNTHFVQGITTASFGAGIAASNVVVTGPTTASVDLAVSTQAASGFRTATFTTLGEAASLDLAFNVGPSTPTLNAAAPFTGQRGQSLAVRLIGQYTHWTQGTTVTFGQGITVNGLSVVDATTVDASIAVSALATLGARNVTVTTGGEIVSAPVFSVVEGGASITEVAPQSGNQGQEIVLAITGQNTNWQQGFTQFSIAGAGGDIRINYVVVNSPTSATAGITIGPAATLGARSIYMVTGAEALVFANALVVTGGVPAIGSVSPGSARAGDSAVNIQIAGLHTRWLAGSTTVDFGPGVTVTTFTVDSDTHITAVVDVHPAAALGSRTVIVRNVTQTKSQALTGYFAVVSPQPPAPFIAYLSPASGLRGQTFTITMNALHTHWDPSPLATRVDFGDPGSSGIAINSFQVTSPTSARVNITIAPDAAFGVRTVSVTADTATGSEVVQTAFVVVEATPTLAIVDPAAGMQGATVTVNVLAQHTAFDETTTFDFGPGVAVEQVVALGPTVAQVRIAIDLLAPQGFRFVTAVTGGSIVGGAGFVVTPSQAAIVSVAPNTARQQETLSLDVVGVNTHWSGATAFSLSGGIDVVASTVTDSTHASLVVAVAPLASLGAQSVTATTGGEVASLANAFVVQPGTPLILSSTPGLALQQANVTLTVLGQSTGWAAGGTSVDLGIGVTIDSVTVSSPTALTVLAHVDPLTALGYRHLTVTTGAQVLTLPNALLIAPGPAAIAHVSPTNADQGDTLNVAVTGTNTHFIQGVTAADFGPGVTVNSVQVVSPTSAVVNISIAANATVGLRSVVLSTPFETAVRVDAFIVNQGTPLLQFVTPVSGAQGQTVPVTVIGSLTAFSGSTTFDFGPGVTVTGKTIVSATQADVTIAISPLAARTTRDVSATTGGVTAAGAALFTVTAGPATITDVTPADVYQDQNNVSITIAGVATHFNAATPTVGLGPGVTITQVIVDSATQVRVTADVSPTAPVQFNDVVVTTGGEVASLSGVFQVRVAPPVIVSTSPSSAYQEQTLDVAVTGAFTHFSVGATAASFGDGIVVNALTVVGHTQAIANISIGTAAAPGDRTLTLTTAGETAVGAARFTVLEKITPTITWPVPANITFGTALGAGQLNATTGVAGAFVYTPDAGTLLNAGAGQQLSVVFTPTDTIAYRSATASVFITVEQAPQAALTVTGAPPSAANGASFVVSTTGGSGNGAVTFSATGACGNTGGGASITMTAGVGTCTIVATKQGDANYLIATSAAALVSAITPSAALGNQIIGGFDGARAGGYGLTDGSALASFRGDLGSLLPNVRVSATPQLTDAFFASVDVALLSPTTSSSSATSLAADEQAALLRFVQNGGGAVIIVDNDGSSAGADAANNSFLAPFGMHVTGTHVTPSSAATITNPAASPVTSGPFGTITNLSLAFPGWIDALGPATSLGTLDFNGQPFLAVIAPGALGTGSGAVVVMSNSDLESAFWNAAYRSLVFNAITHVTPPVLADFEQGGLAGWTLTGSAWTVGGTTNTSPNVVPVSGVAFARSGAPNVAPPAVLAEANVGSATSPAYSVSGRVLSWYSTGWSGPGNDGASRFEILDASLTVRAQIPTPQSDSWVRLSVDLLHVGLSPGQTFYFRAVDAHPENNYAWLAFDRLAIRGTLARLPQAVLSVTNAPALAAFGSSFTVGASGGSGAGSVMFSASGACANVGGGAQITMTSGTGTCSITATKAADANYEAASSPTVTVQATATAPAVLDIAQEAAFIAVRIDGSTITSIPAALSVRLMAAGLSIKVPPGGVAVTALSSNPACVAVSDATAPAGAFVLALPISYGGTASLPCESTVSVSNPSYAGDTVVVSVASYATAPFSAAASSLSYFNPAPVPDPAGALQVKIAALSYYNPAPLPTPSGTYATNTAALSYFNPASIPAASGAVSTNTAAVSYYNPAPVPTPNGAYSTNTAAMSYYNPAPVPSAAAAVWASVVSVSYQNGTEPTGQSAPLTAESQQRARQDVSTSPAAVVTALSLANGPTASRVAPPRVSRSSPVAYTLTIDGINLGDASAVRFVGLEGYVSVGLVTVSGDGRRVTVDVFVTPGTPLGVVPIVVSGPGWNTPDSPSMRVEIVQ